jgi:malate dehydrogenase (oxaloacetate-decarboxylating)
MFSYSKRIDTFTGEEYVEVPVKGILLTEEPIYNKETAFTETERHSLGLCGLLPDHISTLEQQKERNYEAFLRKPNDIEKYIYLIALQDRNETAFYATLMDHLTEMLPIVYTPTVGKACQQFSHIYRRRRGLYISSKNIEHIDSILSNLHFSNVSLIVVTDGERILGLGDLGMNGMGIPVGKISLYVAAAGIHPAYTMPIFIDVGTNNEELLADPLYLGLRQKRLTGDAYYEVIETFVAGIRRHFPNALLQWEDFGKNHAFKLLKTYRERICSFDDDIQGTGAVALSVLLSAMRIKKEKLGDQRIVIFGQGQAGVGIARQIVNALQDEGLSLDEAKERVFGIDKEGLLLQGMRVTEEQELLLKDKNLVSNWPLEDSNRITLLDTVRNVKATVLIGVTGQSGAFSKDILEQMARNTQLPLIMPISNPTSKSECTPEFAIKAMKGNCLIATGSPFKPISYEGRDRIISQCNNLYVFPGMGLGALVSGASRITGQMFSASARSISALLSGDELDRGILLPPIKKIRHVSAAVALAVAKEARDSGLGRLLDDNRLSEMINQAMWIPRYLPYRYVKPETLV